jgi:thiol-disulfide isomerase/thioredoxin
MFAAVGLLAGLAGLALWLGSRDRGAASVGAPEITLASMQAASFTDLQGRPQSLGQFHGKVVVVNFWATWCAPCREEMPAFVRLQERWSSRNVQFVGLANEEPLRVERFAKDLGINSPLWVGGDAVGELSRRLGNRLGVLPHTVLLDPQGRVVESRVGAYTEALLEERLRALGH